MADGNEGGGATEAEVNKGGGQGELGRVPPFAGPARPLARTTGPSRPGAWGLASSTAFLGGPSEISRGKFSGVLFVTTSTRIDVRCGE